jgi:hypothetical protein
MSFNTFVAFCPLCRSRSAVSLQEEVAWEVFSTNYLDSRANYDKLDNHIHAGRIYLLSLDCSAKQWRIADTIGSKDVTQSPAMARNV